MIQKSCVLFIHVLNILKIIILLSFKFGMQQPEVLNGFLLLKGCLVVRWVNFIAATIPRYIDAYRGSTKQVLKGRGISCN